MIKEDSLPVALKMKLATIDDLVRMAFFSAARNHGLNFLFFKDKGKYFIGFLTGVAGYFDLRGLPMFFYVEMDGKPEKSKFIKYESTEGEKWSFCEATPTTMKWSYLPIIELAEKPTFF
ncbi:MAG TPA: hypothetical protein VMZ29_16565 [Candidatus Bathyarchaeia archaeon]|nr:hypothetical protein [Candidatus Bathyarchaeia archaeon]